MVCLLTIPLTVMIKLSEEWRVFLAFILICSFVFVTIETSFTEVGGGEGKKYS